MCAFATQSITLCHCAFPPLFTLEGMLGIVWFVIWLFVAFDDPASHPRISSAEKEYIESSMIATAKKVSVCKEVPIRTV